MTFFRIALVMVVIIVASFAVLLVAGLSLVIYGYATKPGWVGVANKTVWDWLDLLLVPLFLAIVGAVGGFLLNQAQKERDLAIEERRAQDEAFQAYLDQMGQLLTQVDQIHLRLRDPWNFSERPLARARTLTILARLKQERKPEVVRFLYEAHLLAKQMEIVRSANLRGTKFDYFDLRGANLSGVELEGSSFQRANLQNANLIEVKLRGANLRRANLRGASLLAAFIEDGDLREADLQQAALLRARLNDTRLNSARLTNADLRYADLARANLTSANLARADLEYANLGDANLASANLTEVNLRYANLAGADLSGTDLRGADLANARVTQRQAEEISRKLHVANNNR